jgi:proton-dependent oligopeptide transporter, POT family
MKVDKRELYCRNVAYRTLIDLRLAAQPNSQILTMNFVTASHTAMTKPVTENEPQLFGHPRRLSFLFATEMWERFSYYGMRALLVLYMVNHLFKPGMADHVLGLPELRQGLDAVFGPLAAQPLASLIYGLYTGLVYLTPIFGGMLADRLIGRTPAIIIGACLMVAGHFMMAFENLFLVALALLILGNGAFKPNISTQVGDLYEPGDRRRDRAYSIFYVGINIGAFFSPLVCGSLGEKVGWHYGFASAGIGMVIGLATYLAGLPRPPAMRATPLILPPSKQPEPFDSARLRRALIGLLILFIPAALFWAAYEQQGNTIALWIDHATDRSINLGVWQGEIPVTWFQAFNPLMIFAFTPPLVALWARPAREPSTIVKLSFGCLLLSAAYLIMAAAAWISGANHASWLWVLFYFVVLTIAELHFNPIGISLISTIAPDHSRSTMMGIWLATSFVGNLLAGWIGGLWSKLSNLEFFLLIAAIAAIAAGLIHLSRPLLSGLLPSKDDELQILQETGVPM